MLWLTATTSTGDKLFFSPCDLPPGFEGEKREQGDHSGAKQHLSTSGQSEQTPAVHLRFHAAVTLDTFQPPAPSNKGLLLVTSKQSQVLLCGKLYQEVPSRKSP